MVVGKTVVDIISGKGDIARTGWAAHKTNTIDIVNDFLKIRENTFLLVKTLFPFHITICNLQTNTIKLLKNTNIIIQCISA